VAEVEKIVLDRRVWMLMEIMLAMTSPTVALDL